MKYIPWPSGYGNTSRVATLSHCYYYHLVTTLKLAVGDHKPTSKMQAGGIRRGSEKMAA
jgi:hypothetical protein